MKNQFRKGLAIASLSLTLLAVLWAPSASAQQFSDWSAPVSLGPVVNSAFNDQHMSISKSGLSLYFSSNRPGGFGEFDLYVTRRLSLDDPWEPPINLGPVINNSARELAPNLTTDGHDLYFHSGRPGGCGDFDLWVSHRKDKFDDLAWEAPQNLGCMINTAARDAGPNYFEDEATGTAFLYFTRNNTPANEDGFDIYVSTRNADGTWGFASLVNELSSPGRDTRTAIRRRDGLEMILSTNRPGGVGSEDLWVSARATTQDTWSLPVNLGPVVNSSAFDGSPAISWDGTTLFFHSLRPGGFGGSDIYMCTRTKLTGSQ